MEDRENKNGFLKGVLVGVLVTAFLGMIVVGMAAGIWVVARSMKVQARRDQAEEISVSGDEGSLDMTRIGVKLNYMKTLIDRYFLFQDDTGMDTEAAEDWIYAGFVYALGDPYSAYYNPKEYQSLNDKTEGEYCGIGVQVSQNMLTGIITVVKVFPDSPAEEAGMLPGDRLYTVGEMEATGTDLNLLVSDYIKGEEGTAVDIEVYRPATDEYIQMNVFRRIVEYPTVEYELLDSGIGYLSISSFDTVTTHQFKTAVDELEARGAAGIVIDLRNNGGGVLDAAEETIDYLLPDDKLVVSFKGAGVSDSAYYTKDGHQVDLPIAVLVNGESASSSEVFTGAMRDNDGAVIVGTKTFGKGIAQGIFEMADGSALKLTTAYYYVPSGECIHEIGIEPDVEVELDEELMTMVEIPREKDNQLQAAVGVLLRGEEAVKKEIEESLAAKEDVAEEEGIAEEDVLEPDREIVKPDAAD